MNTKKNREELFESCPVPKAVATLALPTIASSIVTVIYSLADTFFVGMLNDPIETSAVTLIAPVILLFNAVTNLFGVGCSSLMSRALGVKDYTTVRKSAAFGVYCAILCGLLFSAFSIIFKYPLLTLLGADENTADCCAAYLLWTVNCGAIPSILNVVMSNLNRAEGSAMHASAGVMAGCILNMILDPFFILPQFLNMGAAGAGCATFISNTCACLYFIILLIIKGKNTFVCIDPVMAVPNKTVAKEVFSVGIPASIQNILNVTGMTLLNNITAGYGAEAVSAMGIAHKVALVPLYFSMGGGQGVMPLVGYNYASGNRARMKEAIRFAEKIFIISMFAAGALFFIFAGPLIKLFMTNELIVEYGTGFLRGFSVAIPFLALDFLAVAMFQACGKGRISLIFAVLRKVVLEIPAFIIFNKIFGMYGLSYGQPFAEIILAVAAFIMLEKMMNEAPEKLSFQEK